MVEEYVMEEIYPDLKGEEYFRICDDRGEQYN